MFLTQISFSYLQVKNVFLFVCLKAAVPEESSLYSLGPKRDLSPIIAFEWLQQR